MIITSWSTSGSTGHALGFEPTTLMLWGSSLCCLGGNRERTYRSKYRQISPPRWISMLALKWRYKSEKKKPLITGCNQNDIVDGSAAAELRNVIPQWCGGLFVVCWSVFRTIREKKNQPQSGFLEGAVGKSSTATSFLSHHHHAIMIASVFFFDSSSPPPSTQRRSPLRAASNHFPRLRPGLLLPSVSADSCEIGLLIRAAEI